MPAFVLLAHQRDDGCADAGFGITATKRLGGAVIRNRAKRRLRALVRDIFPEAALAGADHVLIARDAALTLPHDQMTAMVRKALNKAQTRLEQRRLELGQREQAPA